ncbi:hypothetical protein [Dyella agri]|uniref:Uncharacterized protein n=1 Tax=Dyella agri TaxID=1926869 RepID=A0ABW8KNH8_9GAMM
MDKGTYSRLLVDAIGKRFPDTAADIRSRVRLTDLKGNSPEAVLMTTDLLESMIVLPLRAHFDILDRLAPQILGIGPEDNMLLRFDAGTPDEDGHTLPLSPAVLVTERASVEKALLILEEALRDIRNAFGPPTSTPTEGTPSNPSPGGLERELVFGDIYA